MDDEIIDDAEAVVETILDTLLGNSLEEWTVAILAGLATFLVLQVARRFVLQRLARLVFRRRQNAEQASVHLVRQTRFLFMLVVSIYVASRMLAMPDSVSGLISLAAGIAFIIQLGIWAHALIDGILMGSRTDELADESGSATTINVVGMIAKGAVWTIVLLLVLDNLPGVQVTTLIARLGIGGDRDRPGGPEHPGRPVASLSIALDKPFVIGDFIIVGDYRGTVEHIGLKSTRIRSISGEQLIFGNGDLLSSRIQNFKRMVRRRVVFKVGVTYETAPEQIVEVPDKLREIVEAQENTTFDRAHFQEFGESALIFEVVYYVEEPDIILYMDTQQAINLEIMRYFQEVGINFAYPTQTVVLQSQKEPA